MNRDEDTIIAEAVAWHSASVRDDMDWAGFTAWLEADPRHRQAYDEVALTDALLAEHQDVLRGAPVATAANDHDGDAAAPAPYALRRRGLMRWAGVAIAASLIAVLVVPQFLRAPVQSYATGDAARTIALTDGSTVRLAPHSTLSVEGSNQERMVLAGGGWFDIRHDPGRRLAISAGGLEISDIGTRFDVQADGGQVRVEVAEGEVQVVSQALSRPIRLTRGRGLLFDADGGTALVAPVAQENIGEWRNGRLSYDSVPLALVAADLSRYAGVRVTVAAPLRDRQFSGTLVIGDGEAALRDLSSLMQLELGGGAGAYRLGERR